MIEVNEGKVKVKGTVDIVEMELSVLITSIYDKEPESIKAVLSFLADYMDGKIELKRKEVFDDSF